jgi:pimeloyl-ACP methyl ester carboxylesterase
MLRQGEGEPLVLLHGVALAEGIWGELIPLLAPDYDAVALTAIGHNGGQDAASQPVRVAELVDGVEHSLDELGFQTAHLAGNSLGGWIALELARRGRARSVCALSPAGAWAADEVGDATRTAIRKVARDGRRTRWLLPLALRSKRVRRYALSLNAEHGERVDRRAIVALTDDMLACAVLEDVLETTEELAPLDPPPCPITLAWAEHDRVLPLDSNGRRARELVPGARFTVLEGVGHVPMLDDPQLVAATIREACS